MAAQSVTVACTLPCLYLVHANTSPLAHDPRASNALPSRADTYSVPLSLLSGFALPAVLIALPFPSVLSTNQHQIWLALWQAFPVLVAISHSVNYILVSTQLPATSDTRENRARSLKQTYGLLKQAGRYAHWTTLSICLWATVYPGAFAPKVSSRLSFGHVFIPSAFTLGQAVPSAVAGSHLFLQWDRITGIACTLLWCGGMYAQAGIKTGKDLKPREAVWRGLSLLARMALDGAAATAVGIMEERDDLLLEAEGTDKKKA
jgi:hypothetical protein